MKLVSAVQHHSVQTAAMQNLCASYDRVISQRLVQGSQGAGLGKLKYRSGYLNSADFGMQKLARLDYQEIVQRQEYPVTLIRGSTHYTFTSQSKSQQNL